MAFLKEGAVKDLVTRGPKLEDMVAWAEDFVIHDDVVPTPSIPDYARGHGLTVSQLETLANIHLGDAEDPHSEEVLMKLIGELEAFEINESNKTKDMKESIKMPRLLKEDHHKECSDEVQMAKIQLKSIMADAGEILQGLEQCEQLDAWVQSKLAVADDHLSAIAKYMKYEEEAPEKELPLIPEPSPAEMVPEPPMGPDEEPDMDDLGLFSQPEADDLADEGPAEIEVEVFAQPETKADVPPVEVEDELDVEDLEECGVGIMESEILMPRLRPVNESWNEAKLQDFLRSLRADGPIDDMEAFDIADGILFDEPELEAYVRDVKGIEDVQGWLADRIV